MDLVDALQREGDLPLVVHLMDEGMTAPRGSGLFRSVYRRAHERLLIDLLGRARVRMAIGDAMAREYRGRYGVPFASFQNTVEVSRFDAARRPPGPRNDPPRVVYVGAIHAVAQDRSLEATAQAVDALRRRGVDLRLEIHSPVALFGEYRRRLEIGPNVRFLDAPEDDDRFVEIVCNADALVLPVNFDAASVRFIRLSMPTKLPAYLASGTPILVYGPRGVAQVDDAVDEGWGRVVDRADPSALATALQEIVADGPLRARLAERAVATARRRHDAPEVRARFRAALAGAAGGAGRP
jgi:glycosyltransferase involved in cell wall biosynthesis